MSDIQAHDRVRVLRGASINKLGWAGHKCVAGHFERIEVLIDGESQVRLLQVRNLEKIESPLTIEPEVPATPIEPEPARKFQNHERVKFVRGIYKGKLAWVGREFNEPEAPYHFCRIEVLVDGETEPVMVNQDKLELWTEDLDPPKEQYVVIDWDLQSMTFVYDEEEAWAVVDARSAPRRLTVHVIKGRIEPKLERPAPKQFKRFEVEVDGDLLTVASVESLTGFKNVRGIE